MQASKQLQRVLGDRRFPDISGKFRGILRCILGQDDGFAELHITSDSFLMGRLQGDCGCNEFLGTQDDLEENFLGLLSCVEGDGEDCLTPELRGEAERLYNANITRW